MIFLFKSYTLAVNHQLLEINKCLIFYCHVTKNGVSTYYSII